MSQSEQISVKLTELQQPNGSQERQSIQRLAMEKMLSNKEMERVVLDSQSVCWRVLRHIYTTTGSA